MPTATEVEVGLEIVANRKELLAELAAVIGVVERKTTIPILANLLFEARVNPDSGRSEILIAATNLDQSVRTSLPVTIRGEGVATVPARKFYDYIKLLQGDDVTLRQEENHWIFVRCGKSKTKMVGMASGSFPQLPVPQGQSIDLPAQTLRLFIDKAFPSISNEESRYTLNGALLEMSPSTLAMVATDGHRLTHISCTSEGLPKGNVIVPAEALKNLRALLAANEDLETVSYWESPETIFFRVAHTTLSSRKLSGQFPNYAAVIPSYDGPAIVLDPAIVEASVARCLLFANTDSRATAMMFAEKELRIHSAAADIGETDETLDIFGGPSEPFTIGFNGEYLKEFFASINSAVEVRFKDDRAPVLFIWRTDEGVTMKHVVMPMQLGGKK